MTLVRSIGRWTMTALVINTIIGTGIFGLPAELTRLLGRASPLAMILGALGIGVIMVCFAEVASQFSESGGPYLYVRTAFGRFLGMQIGWFHLLIDMAGVATCAALFVNYLSRFLPWQLNTWQRALLLAIVIAIPTVANCLGVRSGAMLSNIMTVAKVSVKSGEVRTTSHLLRQNGFIPGRERFRPERAKPKYDRVSTERYRTKLRHWPSFCARTKLHLLPERTTPLMEAS